METLSVTTTEVVKWQTAKGNINTGKSTDNPARFDIITPTNLIFQY